MNVVSFVFQDSFDYLDNLQLSTRKSDLNHKSSDLNLKMRAAAMSVWVFINLLFFGMCGYLYLIWSQYWMYIEKQRLFSKSPGDVQENGLSEINQEAYTLKKYNFNSNNNFTTLTIDSIRKRSAVGAYWNNDKGVQVSVKVAGNVRSSTHIIRKSNGSPRFPNIHKPILEFDSEKYACDDFTTSECERMTIEFKELLLKEFHRVLMGEAKVFRSGLESQNTYDVKYEGHRKELSKMEVLCALKSVAVRTVGPDDQPFARFGYHIPRESLLQGLSYNTCAVVTSAGALLGSHFGEFIDSHDMVLRFNNAPTEGYEDDVGVKTTIRILNSQVVTKPEFNFLEDPLYRNVSLLMWDPANYSSTLEEWYHHPDFPLFTVYKKLLEERKNTDAHLLQPRVLWDLWGVLQDSSPYRLRKNPPSSGFIGVWFALHRCQRVRVFEYVPSVRATRRCHYHAPRDDAACTLGAWHPLAQEKALAERMRDNSDIDVFQIGFIDIVGFRNVTCNG